MPDLHPNPALLGELDGVVQQVGQKLDHAPPVPSDAFREIRGQLKTQAKALDVGHGLEVREHVDDGCRQEKGLILEGQLSGLDPREIEQIVHQPSQATGGGVEPIDLSLLLGVEGAGSK